MSDWKTKLSKSRFSSEREDPYSSQVQLKSKSSCWNGILDFCCWIQEPNEVFSSNGQSAQQCRWNGPNPASHQVFSCTNLSYKQRREGLLYFSRMLLWHYWNNLLPKLIGTAQSMSKCLRLLTNRKLYQTFVGTVSFYRNHF